MTDPEKQCAEALREHAMRTGGLMVGDTITVGDYTVRLTGCDGGQLQFAIDRQPDDYRRKEDR